MRIADGPKCSQQAPEFILGKELSLLGKHCDKILREGKCGPKDMNYISLMMRKLDYSVQEGNCELSWRKQKR